jgi:hypothetical protein
MEATLPVPVVGYPGYWVTKNGNVYSSKSGKMTQKILTLSRVGYYVVGLQLNNKSHTCYVHRLVLNAFSGDCPIGSECLHINGIRTDNRLINLRWGTRAENVADSVRHGTATIGHRNAQALYSRNDIQVIRDMSNQGFKASQIRSVFPGSITTVRRVVLGETYKEV